MTCDECGSTFVKPEGNGAAGYAVTPEGKHICYTCAAEHDKAALAEGRDPGLYLVEKPRDERNGYITEPAEVINWPGSLRFPAVIIGRSVGYTPTGGRVPRVDAHFTDHTGRRWLLTVRGDMELGRAKRLKA